jgi:hypothetical protein
LNNIMTQFPGTPLAQRAMVMLDVLSRRFQIEEELRNLVINRPAEDTVAKKTDPPLVVVTPPVNKPVDKPVTPPNNRPDTVTNKPVPKTVASAYVHTPDAPHYVVLVLNKVDPVFSNEAKNAFARYNRETFYNKPMTIELLQLDTENRLMLVSPFKTAQEAIDYVDRTKPKTASEIIPWLKGGKYSFSIISEKNLEMLKTNKDIIIYDAFIKQSVPGKF